MYIKTRYLQRTSSNYTNSILAAILLLTLIIIVLSDGIVFDLAECSFVIEVLTLVNVIVFSTLLINSVSTHIQREQIIQQAAMAAQAAQGGPPGGGAPPGGGGGLPPEIASMIQGSMAQPGGLPPEMIQQQEPGVDIAMEEALASQAGIE